MRLLPRRLDDSHGARWMLFRWLDVPGNDGIYLTRLTLFRCPWFQVMFQWLQESDAAPDPHDHPWWFIGIVLRGGYDEERVHIEHEQRIWISVTGRKLRRFSINMISSRTPHRIARVLPHTTTLLITGSKSKEWGFYVRDGEWRYIIEPSEDYLGRSGRIK